jgi:hypothetical protein
MGIFLPAVGNMNVVLLNLLFPVYALQLQRHAGLPWQMPFLASIDLAVTTQVLSSGAVVAGPIVRSALFTDWIRGEQQQHALAHVHAQTPARLHAGFLSHSF